MLKTSVKQLEMVFNCPRKWAFHYPFGVPQVEGAALGVGNALHAQMKALINRQPAPYGPETTIGKMARALYQAYVKNASGRHVSEVHENVQLPEYDMIVELRADYLDRPMFYDWKTTGAERSTSKLPNGKVWAKNDLTNDFQANIYAFLLMRHHWAGLERVGAQWCFVSKKFKEGQEPRVWSVGRVFEFQETRAWFEKHCLPAANLIREVRAEFDAGRLDSGILVPHNPASCEFVAKFCDAGGLCRMLPSPVMSYEELHLPVINERN